MAATQVLNLDDVTLADIRALLEPDTKLKISDEVLQKVRDTRDYLMNRISSDSKPVYGVNTGFGSLCNIRISADKLSELQSNLVRSHACGTGTIIPRQISRMILLLKIINLSLGHSGVTVGLLRRLVDMYNNGRIPIMYEQGSLGASGDLAPLSHLSLPLLGEGQYYHSSAGIVDAKVVNDQEQWAPLELQAKEGLALINGTQFSTGLALWSCLEGKKLLDVANLCAAMSYEGYQCDTAPLNHLLHSVRKQSGQLWSANAILNWLNGSNLDQRDRYSVQDPYSMRCSPVVHGASKQAHAHCLDTVMHEINSVTDNPIIFPDEDEIISGGNFHAQPIALSLDYLAIALAELGSISERRSYLLLSGHRSLPPYLVSEPGFQTGLMIGQYTAASIVSQNKQLCTPASVDSIVSSQGQEDHVSMAANAGTRMIKLIDNLWTILAIEFMTATQAISFRKDVRLSAKMEPILSAYRDRVPVLKKDRTLSPDVALTREFLQDYFD